MRFQQQCVSAFMRAIGQEVKNSPGLPKEKIAKLRKKLIKEECVKELCAAIEDGDLLEIADGIGDALYVILGTAAAYGLDALSIFDEVHRSNMTKLKDGYLRADGKFIKGPHHTPPNLKQLIK